MGRGHFLFHQTVDLPRLANELFRRNRVEHRTTLGRSVLNRRTLVLLSAVLLVPVGFGMKAYSGPLAMWVRDSLAGLVYVAFWCLVASAILPRARAFIIAVSVTAVTCVLEVGQLVDHPALTPVREHTLGAALLRTQIRSCL